MMLQCPAGEAMGHSFMGILFARALDPAMATPVPAAYLCKLMLFVFPSSGGKNTIVVSLVVSHGLYVALAVCVLVVIAWAFIFARFFKMRFVKEDGRGSDPDILMPVLTRSRSNSKVKSADTDDLSDMLEFDSYDNDDGNEFKDDRGPLLSDKSAGSGEDLPVDMAFKVVCSDTSAIVHTSHLETIASWLPQNEDMSHISLRYSLQRDGASMQSLLTLCKDTGNFSRGRYHNNSCIMLIEDSWGYIFGAYLAHGLEDMPSYYGNGESFMFSLVPTPAVYKWTGENELFVLSNCRNIAFGGGGAGTIICNDFSLI
jgi:hypothetical protein